MAVNFKGKEDNLVLLRQLCKEGNALRISELLSQTPEILSPDGSRSTTECKDDYVNTLSQLLHFAAEAGMIDIVILLIDKRAPINYPDEEGNTPLDLAIRGGHKEIAKTLLRLHGISRKLDVIHKAVILKNKEIVKSLVSLVGDVNKMDDAGKTPLHVAAQVHNCMIEFLLKLGADINAKCNKKWTALHYAVKCGLTDVVDTLLAKGAALQEADLLGFTPLHIACKNGDLSILLSLLKYGAPVNVLTFGGLTPLHYAAWNDHLDIVSNLLKAGSNINLKTVEGLTPLNLAMLAGSREVTDALIDHGAFPNQGACIQPLHLAAAYNYENIMTLLFQDQQKLEEKDIFDKTPLFWAAEHGNLNVLKILLKRGASYSTSCTDKNITPLHIAAQNGHSSVVNYLLECDANPDVKDSDGNSPLHLAVLGGDVNTVKELALNEVLSNAKNNKNNTPLHLVPESGNSELLHVMIELGANIKNVNCFGNTVIHEAADRGRVDMMTTLVETYKMSLDSPNSSLLLPIHMVVKNGYEDALNYLIKKCDQNAVDINGYSPLHYAVKGGFFNIVKILVENNCDTNIVPRDGKHLLHLAVECGNETNAQKIMEYLVEKCKEKLDALDGNNRTALHIAADNGLCEATKWLLLHNANSELKDNDSCTALHLAVLRGDIATVKELAVKEALCNAKNCTNNTPLHLVPKNGTLELLLLMIKCGSDIAKTNSDGNTVLHEASAMGRADMVAILIGSYKMSADSTNSWSQLPIHLASKNGYEEVVKCLIKTKDINVKDYYGFSSLHYAIMGGFYNVVKILVENKGDISLKSPSGKSALHLATDSKNDEYAVKCIQYLIECGADLGAKDDQGNTVLHVAVESGLFETTRALLLKGANATALDKYNRTPLQLVRSEYQAKFARLFQDHKKY